MVPDLFGIVSDAITLGWLDHAGWRVWYGAGGTITLLLLALRVAPAARRFFQETEWSPPAVVTGLVIWSVGPITALLISALAWPLVVTWLIVTWRRRGTH